jgi:nucleoside-diphosphate-sugar epimerase
MRTLAARGDETVAIVRPSSDAQGLRAAGLTVRTTELDAEEALAEAFEGSDAVVHLAGGGFADQRATWQANADSTRQVLAACDRAGVGRLVLASTVTVTRRRVGAYGASKREAERLALASGLQVTVLRFAFVYGPGRTGVFARFVELARRLPVVPVVGSGGIDIAPVYVEDVVDAIVAALDRPDLAAGKVYTLAGPAATFDDVVDGVLTHLDLRKRKLHLPAPLALALAHLPKSPVTRDNVLGMVQKADHDSSLARAELGFSPRSLDEGLDASF